ncbi:MAG: phosphate acyltransferase PlsX [Oligosphaeraceae bacterium]|nr:phosphate acyltransferase PlsX [Oligosphaeraceae bacterium]
MGPIPIAVDIMGGDNAPGNILEGVCEALDHYGDTYHLHLVGDADQISAGLSRLGKLGDARLTVVPTTAVIEMGEHPAMAIRGKPQASICVAADLVKKKTVQGFFSAGNTGAAVGASYLKWRMLPGLERPALATVFPSETGRFIFLDSGATVDCTPLILTQFAIMGDIYARMVLKKQNPAVGLLCNGTEEGKGIHLTQETFKMLREVPGLNFIGNVEGHDLFSGKVDVVVCDGFVGNVVLKVCEQLAKSMGRMMKKKFMERTIWKLGAFLARGAFAECKKAMDASEVGGSPLLGVDGVCVIGHGNSNAKAVRNGIRVVGEMIAHNTNDNIVKLVKEYGLLQ